MKDNKNFSDDSLGDDILDDVSDIDDIDEEYYAEFGDEEFDDNYDDRLEKVLDELSELKTNMGAPASKQQAAYTPAPNNPNEAALYHEISRLRDELSKTQNTQTIQSELSKLREEFNRNDRGDETVREEVRSLKAQIRALKKGRSTDDIDDIDDVNGYSASGSDIRKLYSEITASLASTEQRIIDAVDAVSKRLDGEIKFAENDDIADVFQALKDLRGDMSKNMRGTDEPGETIISSSSPDEVNLFLSEIVSLRDELQEYKDNVSILIDKVSGVTFGGGVKEDNEPGNDNAAIILDELTSIRTELSNYTDELDGLKTGISDIKNIVRASVASGGGDGSSNLETAVILSEINELKSKAAQGDVSESITALRNELRGLQAGLKNEETELLREEVKRLNEQLKAKPAPSAIFNVESSDLPGDVKDTLSVIFDEIRAIREEPDYSVMNEILALREEFQAFKEQLSNSASAPAPAAVPAAVFDHDGAYAQTVEEIRSLRDQLFAVSMAKVANGKKEPEYENYNNILLDEIASLREDLQQYNKPLTEQMTAIAAAQKEEKSFDGKELEKISSDIAQLKKQLNELKESDKISSEIAQLKEQLNGVSASINSGGDYDKISGDIEMLKESVKGVSDAVEEVNKKETVVNIPPAEIEGIDEIKEHLSAQKEVNKTMLAMLSDMLRAIELLRGKKAEEKPDENYAAVLEEIAKLRGMIESIEKAEPVPAVIEVKPDNRDIEEAITKLRDELTAISGLNEKAAKEMAATKEPKKPAAKKPEAKPAAKKEEKPAAKKTAAKKSEVKKEIKKEEPVKVETAPKLADKQVLDEYVATLDNGGSDDISKMLKSILSYEDPGEDL